MQFNKELESINWKRALNFSAKEVNYKFEKFFDIESLLNIHAPLRKLTNAEIKFQRKPWITLGI